MPLTYCSFHSFESFPFSFVSFHVITIDLPRSQLTRRSHIKTTNPKFYIALKRSRIIGDGNISLIKGSVSYDTVIHVQ